MNRLLPSYLVQDHILYSYYCKNLLYFDVFSLIEMIWIWHIVQLGEFEITSSFIIGSSAVKDNLLQCRDFCWGQWKSVLFIEVRNKLFDSWMVLEWSDFFWTDQAFYWKIKLISSMTWHKYVTILEFHFEQKI